MGLSGTVTWPSPATPSYNLQLAPLPTAPEPETPLLPRHLGSRIATGRRCGIKIPPRTLWTRAKFFFPSFLRRSPLQKRAERGRRHGRRITVATVLPMPFHRAHELHAPLLLRLHQAVHLGEQHNAAIVHFPASDARSPPRSIRAPPSAPALPERFSASAVSSSTSYPSPCACYHLLAIATMVARAMLCRRTPCTCCSASPA